MHFREGIKKKKDNENNENGDEDKNGMKEWMC
jgi:hypothetical protein